MTDRFEAAFSAFLERREYDAAEAALFDIVRASFLADWKAAGGILPEQQPVFHILRKKNE